LRSDKIKFEFARTYRTHSGLVLRVYRGDEFAGFIWKSGVWYSFRGRRYASIDEIMGLL